MLTTIRKFSESVYAKILLGIVVIPFVFWGMGGLFTGGNKNIVVIIDDEKFSTQEFVNFIQKTAPQNSKIDIYQIEEFIKIFVGQKLIEKEIEKFDIVLSNKGLSNLIKNQKDFKRKNIFSRTEYEKFLLENGLTAVAFEKNLSNHELKKQLLQFIGGGIAPPNFLVNNSFNKSNQKRETSIINLGNFFNKNFNFSQDQIKSYYELNKNNYEEIYKSISVVELKPKKLVGVDEYNDLFFQKIDKIDDLINIGENLNSLNNEFNLDEPKIIAINKFGKNLESEKINEISENSVKDFFNINKSEPTILIEDEGKYFIAELIKSEIIQKKLENSSTKKDIVKNLKNEIKRELLSQIISKINQNNYTKNDFDNLANEKKLNVEEFYFENFNDDKNLKKEIVNQIYGAPLKKVILIQSSELTENYLIYVKSVKNVNLETNSDEYGKYLDVARGNIANGLFNTYDDYIKNIYKIEINYKALDVVKNYFE